MATGIRILSDSHEPCGTICDTTQQPLHRGFQGVTESKLAITRPRQATTPPAGLLHPRPTASTGPGSSVAEASAIRGVSPKRWADLIVLAANSSGYEAFPRRTRFSAVRHRQE